MHTRVRRTEPKLYGLIITAYHIQNLRKNNKRKVMIFVEKQSTEKQTVWISKKKLRRKTQFARL